MNPRHVTAAFIIVYVHYCTGGKITLTINQIRVWAHRNKITRVGTDPDGFALYDLDQVLDVLHQRKAIGEAS